MSSWTELLEHPRPGQHVVQLYGRDDQLLTRHLGQYLAEGVRHGDGLLLVATRAHTETIVSALLEEGAAFAEAAGEGRFLALDADETLAGLLAGGEPSAERFEEIVGGAVRELLSRLPHRRVRAFGEMVGLLWEAGIPSAALTLEAWWSRLLERHAISLYCAYPIDVFHGECDGDELGELAAIHSHVYAAPRTLFACPSRGREI